MFPGAIGDDALTFLRYTVLLVSVDSPPFVLSALIDTRSGFLEALRSELGACACPSRCG